MSKKRYKVRVIEQYVDEVWVEAENSTEAKSKLCVRRPQPFTAPIIVK